MQGQGIRAGRVFETLESRQLLTGNVTVSLVGSNLTITGDNAENVVYLVQDSGHLTILSADKTNLVVHGKTGFDVIGTAEVKLNVDVQNVTIRMNGGDDLLEILGNYDYQQPTPLVAALNIPGRLSIDMGNGNNLLMLDGIDVGGTTTIRGGADVNAVGIFAATFEGNFSANLGNGENLLYLGVQSGQSHGANTFNGQFTYTAGRKHDIFADYEGAQFNGAVRVDLGAGDDEADLGASQFNGDTILDGGPGHDTIQLQGLVGPTFNPQARNVIRSFETNQLG
jgi:hypothetical protein